MKKLVSKTFSFIFHAFRPLLGPSGVCIYPVSCGDYAKAAMAEKPLWKALPLITLRVLSCNPITVLFWKLKPHITLVISDLNKWQGKIDGK